MRYSIACVRCAKHSRFADKNQASKEMRQKIKRMFAKYLSYTTEKITDTLNGSCKSDR